MEKIDKDYRQQKLKSLAKLFKPAYHDVLAPNFGTFFLR